MKWIVFVILILSPHAWADPAEVYFSPEGGALDAILRELATAQKGDTVLVQAYGFTRFEIAAALVQAAERGADVEVLLDKENLRDQRSQAEFCASHGIVVRIDRRHPIAHAKVIILVGREVLAGSYNFTAQAEHNSEDLLVLRDPSLAARFTENWHRHEAHSQLLSQAKLTAPRRASGGWSTR